MAPVSASLHEDSPEHNRGPEEALITSGAAPTPAGQHES